MRHPHETSARQICLVCRPQGVPIAEDVNLVDSPVPEIINGEVEIQNPILAVDPYMRPRLNADQALNTPMLGRDWPRSPVAEPPVQLGRLRAPRRGWQDRLVFDAKGMAVLNPDPTPPLSVYMHALGSTGITAYGGLLEVSASKGGEQVFVSTPDAAGSVVAEITKIRAAMSWVPPVRAIRRPGCATRWGSTPWSTTRPKTSPRRWRTSRPNGIESIFENVGGTQLDAALPRMNVRAVSPSAA